MYYIKHKGERIFLDQHETYTTCQTCGKEIEEDVLELAREFPEFDFSCGCRCGACTAKRDSDNIIQLADVRRERAQEEPDSANDIISLEEWRQGFYDQTNPAIRHVLQNDPMIKYCMLVNAYTAQTKEEERDALDVAMQLYSDTNDSIFMTLYVAMNELLVARRVLKQPLN